MATKDSISLTQEYLRSYIDYCPETGQFRWKNKPHITKKYIGQVANSHDRDGYITVKIKRVKYLAHRLAWFYVRGVWPQKQLDHINRIRDDNRICNLREADSSKNMMNCVFAKVSNTGTRGVYKDRKKWRARMWLNNGVFHLGTFDSLEEAREARRQAEIKYHGDWRLNS